MTADYGKVIHYGFSTSFLEAAYHTIKILNYNHRNLSYPVVLL